MFDAANDLEAIWIAREVFGACDDVSEGYWLWAERNRLVATSLQRRPQLAQKHLTAMDEQRTRNVLELEHALQTSRGSLARSRKLRWHTTQLREKLDG